MPEPAVPPPAPPQVRDDRAFRWGLVVLALAALPTSAQTLYRCGNTYSQTPCASEAQAVRVYAASSPKSEPGPRGFALCAAQLPAVQVAHAQPLGKRRTEVIRYAGQPVQALRFDLSAPPQPGTAVALHYGCWLSEDQARLLQFEPLPAPVAR